MLAALALLLGVAAIARAADPEPGPENLASALAARVEQRGEVTRLVFELSERVEATAFAVEGPKIVVDLPLVAFPLDPAVGRDPVALEVADQKRASARPAAKLINAYRFGQFARQRSRIVIELARPAKVLRAASVAYPAGVRLEIDLAPEDAAKFAEAVAAHAKAVAQARSETPTTPPAGTVDKDFSALPLVVIDPGHGGVDNGASAKNGALEKAIVLEFAKALKAKLEERGKLRVLLTREDDVFVPLDERVRFAQERGAALLLSIHADTLGAANVQGATIYTSAARASDAEAARVAAKENLADQAAGVERKDEAEQVGDILFELTRRETRALSGRFASALIAKWRQAAAALNKNPSRAAHFVVLKAHDVPSALLELGYLSSEKDLANLTSPEWRARAAQGAAEAIFAYFQVRDRNALGPDVTGSVRQ